MAGEQQRPTLAAEVHGSDGPWLTLLHGGLVGMASWRHAVTALSRWSRVVTCDFRGYGESPLGPEGYGMADHARDVIDLWDALGVDRGHVVGFSMGGMVAQELALAAPDRVDRLVLVSTAAGLDESARRGFAERAAALERGDAGAEVERHVDRAFSGEFLDDQPEVVARYRSQAAGTSTASVAQSLRAIADFDRRGDLADIASPTLVLAGGRDPGMGEAPARELAGELAHAHVTVLPNHGHTIHIEAPSTFAYVLADFLLFESGQAT